MNITRVSLATGKTHTKDLPITDEQLRRWTQGNELIQRVFPDLSPDDREFLQTGITPEEWAAIFPPEEPEP